MFTKGMLKGNGLRVVAFGGRDYNDRETAFRALDKIHRLRRILVLISGCAPGLDTLAIEWATLRGVPVARFPVTRGEWKTVGRAAGPLRNQRMIDEGCPDVGVRFPGGAGTADMAKRCEWKGIPVWEV